MDDSSQLTTSDSKPLATDVSIQPNTNGSLAEPVSSPAESLEPVTPVTNEPNEPDGATTSVDPQTPLETPPLEPAESTPGVQETANPTDASASQAPTEEHPYKLENVRMSSDEPTVPAAKPTPTATEVSSAFSFTALLAKARAAITARRTKKLDRIVELARKKGRITNDDVQKLLRVSDATASRYLRLLVASGRLRRIGMPNHSSYEPI